MLTTWGAEPSPQLIVQLLIVRSPAGPVPGVSLNDSTSVIGPEPLIVRAAPTITVFDCTAVVPSSSVAENWMVRAAAVVNTCVAVAGVPVYASSGEPSPQLMLQVRTVSAPG